MNRQAVVAAVQKEREGTNKLHSYIKSYSGSATRVNKRNRKVRDSDPLRQGGWEVTTLWDTRILTSDKIPTGGI